MEHPSRERVATRHPKSGEGGIPIFALRKTVEKHIDRGNATVPGNDKIGSRVSGRFAGSARYPSNPSGITQFLGRGERLVFEIWVGCFYHTSNAINLVTASVDASLGIVEHTIFIPNVVDGRATTRGVIFAKYVAQI